MDWFYAKVLETSQPSQCTSTEKHPSRATKEFCVRGGPILVTERSCGETEWVNQRALFSRPGMEQRGSTFFDYEQRISRRFLS